MGLVDLGGARRLLGGLLGERRDLVAQRRVGCEHAVIAMAMHTRAWHERGNPVDEFQRAERQLAGLVGLRLGQVIAEPKGSPFS